MHVQLTDLKHDFKTSTILRLKFQKLIFMQCFILQQHRTTARCSSLFYIIDLSTQSSKCRTFGGDWSHSRGSRGICNIKAFLSRCWESASLGFLTRPFGRHYLLVQEDLLPSVCQCVRTRMYAYTDTCIIRALYRLAGAAEVTQKGRKGTDLSRLVRR